MEPRTSRREDMITIVLSLWVVARQNLNIRSAWIPSTAGPGAVAI